MSDKDDPVEKLLDLLEELSGSTSMDDFDDLSDLEDLNDEDGPESPFGSPFGGPFGPDFDDLPFDFEEMADGFADGAAPEVPVDVRETDEEFVVLADLPGFQKEDIDLQLSDEKLHLSASRETDETTEEGTFVKHERYTESTSRVLELDEEVDSEAVEATFENGVLSVTLPKKSAGGAEEISID